MNHLGIDIGGTYIKYALVNQDFLIIDKWKKPTHQFLTKDEFYDYLCQDIDVKDIDFVGVSTAGIIDADSNVLSKAADTICIMFQTNINQEIQKRLFRPVYAMNDARAAGLCELKFGNAKGSKISAYLIIGTGVGGCVFHGEKDFTGIDHLAGEFSFLPFAMKDGQIISLSHYASMSALIEIYNSKVSSDCYLQYGQDICHLYLKGNQTASEAMEEWCRNIIFALNTMVICYNPEIICIGGGISEEDWFIKKIQDMFASSLPKRVKHLITTKVERCAYHNDANILGAVADAYQNIKEI